MDEPEQQGIPEAAHVRHLHKVSNKKACYLILFLVIQKVLEADELSSRTPRSKVELQSLSTRSYLDHTVVPILLDAMTVVARERWQYTIE